MERERRIQERLRNWKHRLLMIAALVLAIALLLYSLMGGRKKRDILGGWVVSDSVPACGFQCGRGGLASSIHNSKCQYSSWEISRGNLILNGKVFSESNVEPFSDTMKIVRLNSKLLVVYNDGEKVTYTKIR